MDSTVRKGSHRLWVMPVRQKISQERKVNIYAALYGINSNAIQFLDIKSM